MADVWEANINVVGNWRIRALGDLNGRAIISLEEVREAVNEMNLARLPGWMDFR